MQNLHKSPPQVLSGISGLQKLIISPFLAETDPGNINLNETGFSVDVWLLPPPPPVEGTGTGTVITSGSLNLISKL